MASKFGIWWQKIKRHWRAIVVVAIVLVAIVGSVVAGYMFDWTGFSGYNKVSTAIEMTSSPPKITRTEEYQPGKTLWDWLQLLIIPFVLAIGGYAFNLTTSRNEQKNTQLRDQTERDIAGDNQREAALQAYIDKMSELLLEKRLRESAGDNELRKVARVRTLTVLPRLDQTRKKSVLQFLYESELIDKDKCIVNLKGADLTEAPLRGADLHGANLSEADLSRATLSFATLREADLHGAKLSGAALRSATLDHASLSGATLDHVYLDHANLSGAILSFATLRGANLSGAILRGADLSEANLDEADLNFADLSGAILRGALLTRADLHGANLSEADLSEANLGGTTLRGATLSRATLSGADLRVTTFSNALLDGANLREAILSDALLDGANLRGAILSNANQLNEAESLQDATMPDGSKHS